MLAKNLNSSFLKKQPLVIKSLIIFGVIFILNALIFIFNTSKSDHLITTKDNLKIAQNKLKKIDTFNHQARHNFEVYQDFQSQKVERSDNIDDIIDFIQSLQSKLNIPFLNTTIKNKDQKNHLQTISIEIEMKTLTDLTFFKFIKKLEEELPAIVKIKAFTFEKEEKPTTRFFKKFAKNPNNAHLCSGTIEANFTISVPNYN